MSINVPVTFFKNVPVTFFHAIISLMKIAISLLLLTIIFSSCQRHAVNEFPWKPYSKQAVADAIAHHKPVVIDFWAEWCPVCHELDDTVFSRPDIQSKLSGITALKVDATNQEDPQVQQIAQEYEIEGLPTVVFLDRKGKEITNSRVIGLVTPKEMDQALAVLTLLK